MIVVFLSVQQPTIATLSALLTIPLTHENIIILCYAISWFDTTSCAYPVLFVR